MVGAGFWVWGAGEENYGGDEICLAPFGWVQGARLGIVVAIGFSLQLKLGAGFWV